METFGKLVRDNMPYLISKLGKKCDVETISEEHQLEYLYIKLNEELYELIQDESLDGLADMLEIVFSIGEKYGYTNEELLNKRDLKKAELGAFEKSVLLKEIY